MVFEIMDEKSIAGYRHQGSLDLAYQLEGADRFRINVFPPARNDVHRRAADSAEILGFKELHLPETLAAWRCAQGLILLTGITGTGKSTTIAAMLEEINRTRACHIYDPRRPHRVRLSGQDGLRKPAGVGLDVGNYSDAFKYMMRGSRRGADRRASGPGDVRCGPVRRGDRTPCFRYDSCVQARVERSLGFRSFFPEEPAPGANSLVANLQAIVSRKLLRDPSGNPRVFPRARS